MRAWRSAIDTGGIDSQSAIGTRSHTVLVMGEVTSCTVETSCRIALPATRMAIDALSTSRIGGIGATR